jgi:hypothetical protein
LSEFRSVARRVERALGDDDGRAFRQEGVRERRRFTSRERPGGFACLRYVAGERVVDIVEIDDRDGNAGAPQFASKLSSDGALAARNRPGDHDDHGLRGMRR